MVSLEFRSGRTRRMDISRIVEGAIGSYVNLIGSDGSVTRVRVTSELVYTLRVRVLERRTIAIVDGWASDIEPGCTSEQIREVLKADKRRGEKGGGTEPTGTRKTMRECMSRASVLLWDGKL